MIAAIVAGTFVLSVLLTGAVRRYALAHAVLDVPNERRWHLQPTPRGGGLAIAASFLAAVSVLWALGRVPGRLAAALVLGGGAVAVLGWIDDHRNLPIRVRFPAQLAIAGGAVWLLGGLPWLEWGGGRVHLGAVGAALAVVGIAWCLNLFNFMDGINGMAAGEAVIVGAAASVLLLAAGASGVALPAMLLSAAALGFLPWNWPNARIFMGDVGSNLLGFVSGVLAVASENARGLPLLAWAVLAAVFIFDTTITLVRRVRRGERLHHIHRRHAYQRAVQTGYSHGVVSGSVMLLDVVLAAGAGLALAHPPLLLPVLAAAFLLVACVYLWMERVLPMFASPPPPAPQHVPERRKQPTA